MTTVQITGNSSAAMKFVEYARTLPFAKVIEEPVVPVAKWQQALDDGAVTVDEFFDELDARIQKWPDNA